MAMISVVFGTLALLGYAVFLLTHGQSAVLYWGAAICGIVAVVFGIMGRKQKQGRIGLGVGLISLAVGLALFLWLNMQPA